MKGKTAQLIFLILCIVLAVLILTQVITTIVGSTLFAIVLLLLGGLSNGFRKK
jgi:hypothetical protein